MPNGQFTLNVTFLDLCLYVPDAYDQRLLALLPGYGTGDDRHVPRLVYDKVYEGTRLPNQALACIPLDSKELRFFAGLSHPQSSFQPPHTIVDLNSLTAVGPVDPAYFGPTPGFSGARASLVPGQLRAATAAGFSRVKDDDARRRECAAMLTWTVQSSEAALEPGEMWDIVSFAGAPTGEAKRLRPFANGRINLFVFNTPHRYVPPPSERPRPARRGDPADHLEGLFQLFPKATPVPLYLLDNVPAPPVALPFPSDCKPGEGTPGDADVEPVIPAVPYVVTCIGGQAPLGR